MDARRTPVNSRPDARDIIENFIHRVEAVVPLQDDGRRGVAHEHAIEEFERFGRHRMRVGIGEERLWQPRVAHGDAAGHMDLAHESGRQIAKKGVRVEAVVAGVEMEVLDIEQEAGAGFTTDQVEELSVGEV